MKAKLKIMIPLLILMVLAAAALIYTRPLSLSQICDDIDIAKIESLNVTYEVYSDDEVVQYNINRDDPCFLLITDLIAGQKYRRTIWNIFPQTSKTHILRDGDFKWELGCVASDAVLSNGEIVSGTVIHISNFYGKLEITFAAEGKSWRCTTADQERWISEIMDTIAA